MISIESNIIISILIILWHVGFLYLYIPIYDIHTSSKSWYFHFFLIFKDSQIQPRISLDKPPICPWSQHGSGPSKTRVSKRYGTFLASKSGPALKGLVGLNPAPGWTTWWGETLLENQQKHVFLEKLRNKKRMKRTKDDVFLGFLVKRNFDYGKSLKSDKWNNHWFYDIFEWKSSRNRCFGDFVDLRYFNMMQLKLPFQRFSAFYIRKI